MKHSECHHPGNPCHAGCTGFEETVVPFTNYECVLKLRRIAQFVYDIGVHDSDGRDWMSYLQASASVESILREFDKL